MYGLLGHYDRPIGEHRDDGEQIHQSVLDRINVAALKYAPTNLPAALCKGAQALPIVNTRRIARGTACQPNARAPLNTALAGRN